METPVVAPSVISEQVTKGQVECRSKGGFFGMDAIQKSTVNRINAYWPFNITVAYPEPNPTDPWLFTDPVAIEIYRQSERLEALEEDIFTYVMYDGQWAPEEMECQCEIRRLLGEGLLKPTDRFGD
jgi:hypothetical protein